MVETSFWNTTFARALSGYAALAFLVLWAGLAAALLFNPDWLQSLWAWVNGLPPLPRILAWVFATPLLTALWIWNAPRSLALRLLGFTGLLGWTALALSSLIREWLKPAPLRGRGQREIQ